MGGVVTIFSLVKDLKRTMRIFSCKRMKILLQHPINNLLLAIRMRVISGDLIQNSATKCEYFTPKITQKNRITSEIIVLGKPCNLHTIWENNSATFGAV